MGTRADEHLSATASAKQVGRQIRAVRKSKGLSRSEVARSAGLTRRELAAYERGKVPIPESDLWCVAGSCGVDVNELLPPQSPVHFDSDLAALTVGSSIRRLRAAAQAQGPLRDHLATLYELRNLPPGSRVPVRDCDLAKLAAALGATPETIEARLCELLGTSREEAARLRAMILPPMPLPAPRPDVEDPVRATPREAAATPGAAGGLAPPTGPALPPPTGPAFPPPPDPAFPAPFAPRSGSAFPPPCGPAFPPPPDRADPVPVTAGILAPPLLPGSPDATPPPSPWPQPAPAMAVAARMLPGEQVGDPVATARFFDARPPEDLFGDEPSGFDAPPATTGPPPPPSSPPDAFHTPFVGDDPFAPEVEDLFASPFDPTPSSQRVGVPGWLRRRAHAREAEADGDPDVPHAPRDRCSPDRGHSPMSPWTVSTDEARATGWLVDAPTEPFFPSQHDWPGTATDPFVPATAPGNGTAEGWREAEGSLDHLRPITWTMPAAEALPAAADDRVATPTGRHVGTETTSWTEALPFEQVGANWQIGGIFPATATAGDGTLALGRADVRWALADVEAPGDLTIEACVEFSSGAGFGILFRAAADDAGSISGYSFDVDPVYAGGGYLVRQWHDNLQHWKPLAHAPVADPGDLYGRHTILVSVTGDELVAVVDGETVLTVAPLSRHSKDAGREPCCGAGIGIQAWSTTEVTVAQFRIARH